MLGKTPNRKQKMKLGASILLQNLLELVLPKTTTRVVVVTTRSRVLVSTIFTRFTVNPAITGWSPCFSQKFFRAFFGTVRLSHFLSAPCGFFSNFFNLQRVPPSSFFDILQPTKMPKNPKFFPFYVIRHIETVQNSHFSFCFEN